MGRNLQPFFVQPSHWLFAIRTESFPRGEITGGLKATPKHFRFNSLIILPNALRTLAGRCPGFADIPKSCISDFRIFPTAEALRPWQPRRVPRSVVCRNIRGGRSSGGVPIELTLSPDPSSDAIRVTAGAPATLVIIEARRKNRIVGYRITGVAAAKLP